MQKGLFTRLALDGIKKNKKTYIPYIISIAVVVEIFYLLTYLSEAPAIRNIANGKDLQAIMMLGKYVILNFSLAFLWYTNSFLAKRRNSEYALYNILGMNKKNVVRILSRETVILGFLGISSGLFAGVILSKLFEILLMKMCGFEPTTTLYFSAGGFVQSILFYFAFLVVLFLVSSAKVVVYKPIDLLKSKQAGEKKPKGNVFWALLGAVILCIAYVTAVRCANSLDALNYFFGAVILVVIATYLLFISGSVMLCNVLKKNKKYYYNKKHFVALSGMSYRMKRNGAGLASICILATMVLVMIAAAGSLYFGKGASLNTVVPSEIIISSDNYDLSVETDSVYEQIDKLADDIEKEHSDFEVSRFHFVLAQGIFTDNGIQLVQSMPGISETGNFAVLKFMSIEEYNKLGDEKISLNPGEILVKDFNGKNAYKKDTIHLAGKDYKIVGKADKRVDNLGEVMILEYIIIVTPEYDEIEAMLASNEKAYTQKTYAVGINTGLSKEEQLDFYHLMPASDCYNIQCRADMFADFSQLYASLFLLGIFLSIAFMGACVLIMYYKQITEGYEDANSYHIMRKVGMTKEEIKKSVNSQTLITFFSPLAAAGVHLAFSCPLVYTMLMAFGVRNLPVFILTYILCYIAFAIFYFFVYKKTVKAYVEIASH